MPTPLPPVVLYLPPSIPQITRGDAGNEETYIADRNGSISVPPGEVDDFLAMGASKQTYSPAPVSNVAADVV